MKDQKNLKDIISYIVIILMVMIAIIKCLEVNKLNIDPKDILSIGATLKVASLLPTALAIFLAFMYKNVILSLASGMLLGGLMVALINGNGFLGFFTTSLTGILDTVSDVDNAGIILLCLAVGGMIEIIRSSGGFIELAKKFTNKINTPRKANLIGQLLGIIVFFDDYANALIVGPVMQPIFDKLKLSREKLAYIVDSTAAPVTGIALISSWVAVEVGVIEEGLANANANMSAYNLFLQSIPFCFYCIFCLLFIFISSLTKKEFGPMYEAEYKARNSLDDNNKTNKNNENIQKGSMWVAILPLLALFIYSLVQFIVVGKANAIENGIITGNETFSIKYLSTIFGQADTIYIVFEATILGSIIAIILGVIKKLFTLKQAIGHFTKGCSQLLETCLILVLAWTMSSFVSNIGAIEYSVNIISSNVAWYLIPLLIFVVCCLVSFAVGSYGCMFIALPMAIPIAIRIIELNPNITNNYLPLIIACGLAGSIFGDHCSPITDCTILSSEGSGCDNFKHVKTQLPYALVTAIVSIVVGIIPTTFGLPVYLSFILGILTFYIILKIFGKEPKENN
ncbi:MAG: hypothetical protein IJH31_02585 [Erysipelotrichaceae bacterium]|nr:hypothetical protein [Erysipelotrichaceae bacterium]